MIPCPGCGASLRYDISSSSVMCDYCGEHYDPYRFDDIDKDAKKNSMNAASYHCPGCGAELITDRTDLTARCSYCGGANLIFDRMSKKLRPDAIIPFAITKEEASRLYLEKAKFAVFSSRLFRNRSVVEDFRGIYMPYWAYKVTLNGDVTNVTTSTKRKGDYVDTIVESANAPLQAVIEGYSHDASKAFDDTISECLAPFSLKDEKPFTPAYLCGMLADASDVSKNPYRDQAREEANFYALRRIESEKSWKAREVFLPYAETDARRVMYPVWFLSVRTGDSISYATVNGTTGKVVADFPMSIPRVLFFALLLAAGFFSFLNLVAMPTPAITAAITCLLTCISLFVNWKQFRLLLNDGKLPYSNSLIVKAPALIFLSACLFLIVLFIARDSRVFTIIILVFIELSMIWLTVRALSHASFKKEELYQKYVNGVLGCIVSGTLIVLIDKPLNIYYYTWSLLCSVIFIVFFANSLRYHATFSKRKPPQFDKGGAVK